MAHTKVYGFCDAKCKVEVLPMNGGVLTGHLGFKSAEDVTSFPSSWQINRQIRFTDINNQESGLIRLDETGNQKRMIVSRVASIDGTSVSCVMRLCVDKDKSTYVIVPIPSNPTDSSDKVATTSWVNDINSDVLHKSRNETVYGAKTFTSSPWLMADGNMGIISKHTGKALGDAWGRYRWDIAYDKNGTFVGEYRVTSDPNVTNSVLQSHHLKPDGTVVSASLTLSAKRDGTTYLTVPTTPSNANGNEVAVASWVNNKTEWKQVTSEPTSSAPLTDVVSVSDNVVTFLKDVRVDVCGYNNRHFFGSAVIHKGTKVYNNEINLTPSVITSYTNGFVGFTEVRILVHTGLFIWGASMYSYDFKTSAYTDVGDLTFTSGVLGAMPGSSNRNHYAIYTRG